MKYNSFKKQRKSKKKATMVEEWTPLVKLEKTKENFPNVNIDSLEYDEYWINNKYIVKVYYPDNPTHQFPNNKFTWLSFRNLKNTHGAHDWRYMQMIKNEICGHERTAVEVFPPMSKLVDTCNQFHLWVYPEDYKLDFGYSEKSIMPNQQIAATILLNTFHRSIKDAETEQEKRQLRSTLHRLLQDPTHGKQRDMPKDFLPKEMMKELGYVYEDAKFRYVGEEE